VAGIAESWSAIAADGWSFGSVHFESGPSHSFGATVAKIIPRP
jgi:hypothetical protein